MKFLSSSIIASFSHKQRFVYKEDFKSVEHNINLDDKAIRRMAKAHLSDLKEELDVSLDDGIDYDDAINLLTPYSDQKFNTKRRLSDGTKNPDYVPENDNPEKSMRAVLGMQAALKLLDYNPGKLDGFWGDNTSGALKKFQKASKNGEFGGTNKYSVKVDGDPGPNSTKALIAALNTKKQADSMADDDAYAYAGETMTAATDDMIYDSMDEMESDETDEEALARLETFADKFKKEITAAPGEKGFIIDGFDTKKFKFTGYRVYDSSGARIDNPKTPFDKQLFAIYNKGACKINANTKPGKYTIKQVIKDIKSGKTKTVTINFEVKKAPRVVDTTIETDSDSDHINSSFETASEIPQLILSNFPKEILEDEEEIEALSDNQFRLSLKGTFNPVIVSVNNSEITVFGYLDLSGIKNPPNGAFKNVTTINGKFYYPYEKSNVLPNLKYVQLSCDLRGLDDPKEFFNKHSNFKVGSGLIYLKKGKINDISKSKLLSILGHPNEGFFSETPDSTMRDPLNPAKTYNFTKISLPSEEEEFEVIMRTSLNNIQKLLYSYYKGKTIILIDDDGKLTKYKGIKNGEKFDLEEVDDQSQTAVPGPTDLLETAAGKIMDSSPDTPQKPNWEELSKLSPNNQSEAKMSPEKQKLINFLTRKSLNTTNKEDLSIRMRTKNSFILKDNESGTTYDVFPQDDGSCYVTNFENVRFKVERSSFVDGHSIDDIFGLKLLANRKFAETRERMSKRK